MFRSVNFDVCVATGGEEGSAKFELRLDAAIAGSGRSSGRSWLVPGGLGTSSLWGVWPSAKSVSGVSYGLESGDEDAAVRGLGTVELRLLVRPFLRQTKSSLYLGSEIEIFLDWLPSSFKRPVWRALVGDDAVVGSPTRVSATLDMVSLLDNGSREGEAPGVNKPMM